MSDDQKDKERLKKALDAMIFLPHLKDRQAQSVLSAIIPDDKATRATGRPWDRGDLFRRLKTFKSSTWFAKPNSISAEECARRGWQNTEIDVITCESCKAVVSCPIPMQLLPDEAQKVAEKYSKQICEAHAVGCPWRSATCSLSLLHFPHMPKSAVGLDFEERSTTLRRVLCLPPIDPEAVETMLSGPLGSTVAQILESGPVAASAAGGNLIIVTENQQRQRNNSVSTSPSTAALTALLTSGGVSTCDQEAYTRRLRAIALCGWGLEILSSSERSLKDSAVAVSIHGDKSTLIDKNNNSNASNIVQQCRMGPESAMLSCALCGAKAGLWTNFPECTPQAMAATPTTTTAAATAAAAIIPRPGSRNPQTKTITTATGGTAAGSLPASTPAKAIAGVISPLQSPGSAGGGGGGGGVLHRHVSVNVATTIAGGSIGESDTNMVFGRSTNVFGRGPPPAAPLFGASPPADAARGPAASAAAAAAAAADEDESLPVFGFAALRAAEPGAVNPTHILVQQGAKRRRDDAAWVEATISEKASLTNGAGGDGGDKRQRTAGATGGAAVPSITEPTRTTMPPPSSALPAVAAVPSHAVLQEYRSMQSTPLNPLTLHRRFCPWVHAAGTGTGTSGGVSTTEDRGTVVLCGWQWCAQQLGPETSGLFASGGGGGGEDDEDEDGNGEGEGGGGGRAAAWNPAAVLRNALSKVEVKRS